MSTAYFRTEDLCCGYDGSTVVSGADISLPRGSILTFIGPNGAGKSTILKTLAGRMPPVSGNIYLDGKKIADYTRHELARSMAVMLTERLSTEMMTAIEVVEGGRYPYTGALGVLSADDHEAVARAVHAARIEELAGRDFMQLSDGQRQRVLLARAIAQEPDLLILDEPSSYLDIRYQLELTDILRAMCRERSTTVVMSLHELFLARRVSDVIMCVKDGLIDRTGSPDEIFSGNYIDSLYDLASGTYGSLI